MLTQSCGETGQYPFIHAVKLKKNNFSLSNAVVFSAIKKKTAFDDHCSHVHEFIRSKEREYHISKRELNTAKCHLSTFCHSPATKCRVTQKSIQKLKGENK